MNTEYKIYVFDKLKVKDIGIILLYFALNILPVYFLKVDSLLAFLLVLPMISVTIFMGSDFLKSTRNFNLFIAWLILYIIIYTVQYKYIVMTFDVSNTDVDFMLRSIRMPLIFILYAQIFRVLFVSIYKYEPSTFWYADRIAAKIISRETKNKEDYIWFFLGRIIMLVVIMLINFVML